MSVILGEAKPPVEPAAPAPVHVEYPLVLTHPNARKATCTGRPGTEKRDSMGRPIPGEFWSFDGTPDFMPPVTVNNYDQEQAHMALGYRRGGVSDVSAFSNLACGASAKAEPPAEYPKWVMGEIVQNAEEEAAALRGKATASPGVPASPAEAGPAEIAPKPRHVASPRVRKPAAPIGGHKRQWSPERRAAYEAAKASP